MFDLCVALFLKMRRLRRDKHQKDKKGIDKHVLLLLALACALIIRMLRVDSEFLEAFANKSHLSFSLYTKTSVNSNVGSTTTTYIPKVGDLFVPGSLNLTRLETNQLCHIDQELYQHHFFNDYRYISDQHRVVYVQNRKGGSTNIRKKMDIYFNNTAAISNCKKGLPEESVRPQYFVFSTARDPIDRYVSGFQEMLYRWSVKEENLKNRPEFQVPEYLKSMAEEYTSRRKDHDSVLEALQFFVLHHANGGKVANSHLSLQSTSIQPRKCKMVLDAIYDIHEINDVFDKLLQERNITGHSNKQPQKKRSHSVNITKSDMDTEVLRKICQLTALDYCCLNFKLPPECEGAVQCQWVSPPGTQDNSTELKIEAVSPYPVKFPF